MSTTDTRWELAVAREIAEELAALMAPADSTHRLTRSAGCAGATTTAPLEGTDMPWEEIARRLDQIKASLADVGYRPGRTPCRCDVAEALYLLDNLAEDARRRERAEMLAGARQGIARLDAEKRRAS